MVAPARVRPTAPDDPSAEGGLLRAAQRRHCPLGEQGAAGIGGLDRLGISDAAALQVLRQLSQGVLDLLSPHVARSSAWQCKRSHESPDFK